jgi:hypothetical protein
MAHAYEVDMIRVGEDEVLATPVFANKEEMLRYVRSIEEGGGFKLHIYEMAGGQRRRVNG